MGDQHRPDVLLSKEFLEDAGNSLSGGGQELIAQYDFAGTSARAVQRYPRVVLRQLRLQCGNEGLVGTSGILDPARVGSPVIEHEQRLAGV